MKLLTALVCLMLVAAVPLHAASRGFEGRFVLRIQDADGTRLVSGAMKSDFMRVEVPSDTNAKIIALSDFARGEVFLLLPGQPLYATMPVNEAVAKLADARRTQSQAMLRKTTETVVLLGQPCVKYIAKDKDGTTEIWVAPGLASPRAAAAFQSLARNTPERDLIAQGGLPLRIIGRDATGTANFRMDVTSLEQQPVADGIFQPPADYTKLDVGGFLSGGLSALFGPH